MLHQWQGTSGDLSHSQGQRLWSQDHVLGISEGTRKAQVLLTLLLTEQFVHSKCAAGSKSLLERHRGKHMTIVLISTSLAVWSEPNETQCSLNRSVLSLISFPALQLINIPSCTYLFVPQLLWGQQPQAQFAPSLSCSFANSSTMFAIKECKLKGT